MHSRASVLEIWLQVRSAGASGCEVRRLRQALKRYRLLAGAVQLMQAAR